MCHIHLQLRNLGQQLVICTGLRSIWTLAWVRPGCQAGCNWSNQV